MTKKEKHLKEFLVSLKGIRVTKKSRNPFKSTFKVNTVKDVIINKFTNQFAFTFLEDDSFVNCSQCLLYKEINNEIRN